MDIIGDRKNDAGNVSVCTILLIKYLHHCSRKCVLTTRVPYTPKLRGGSMYLTLHVNQNGYYEHHIKNLQSQRRSAADQSTLPASAPGSLLLCRSSDSTPVPLCPSVPIPYLDPQTTKRKPQFLLICWVSPKYHHGITEYQMHKGPKKYLF
jgi:hypothetical protein